MTTRKGSQYSIQSDGAGLRCRIDPLKGKRKGKISSGTDSTKGSSLSQRQVPEMPIVSKPELELSMSNSNRYQSHSKGSYRRIHEPVQEVLHSVQGQGLENVATNPPRSYELLKHPEKAPQKGGNSERLHWIESTIIKINEYHAKKREASKEESPVASTRKPQVSQPP
ncbi:hypothetical protein O181_057868 [Austropuccinia psidii MF-1]|uniref:Uncharacterized protein n=1 Tax=Austropuccinia psidii MF-1 TaxID=1389203 RepID=A0A9Q3HUX4_9BASI|nr:hypothetical protein [Austropuccinia psidii MF-1]